MNASSHWLRFSCLITHSNEMTEQIEPMTRFCARIAQRLTSDMQKWGLLQYLPIEVDTQTTINPFRIGNGCTCCPRLYSFHRDFTVNNEANDVALWRISSSSSKWQRQFLRLLPQRDCDTNCYGLYNEFDNLNSEYLKSEQQQQRCLLKFPNPIKFRGKWLDQRNNDSRWISDSGDP